MPHIKEKVLLGLLLFLVFLGLSGCAKNQPIAQSIFDKDKQNSSSMAVESDTSDWNIFRNERFGFIFKYPLDLHLDGRPCSTNDNCIMTLCDINNQCVTVDISTNPKDMADKEQFDSKVDKIITGYCNAGGPMGEVYCYKILQKNKIKTNSFNGYQVVAEEITDNYINKTHIVRKRGPFYIFQLPQDGQPIRPQVGSEEGYISFFLSENTSSTQNLNILNEIINTLDIIN